MYFILVFIILIVIAGVVFLQQPQFGKLPSGARLQQIKQSPNYSSGAFVNLSHTPDLTEGISYYTVVKEFLFGKKEQLAPTSTLPSQKTNLHTLAIHQDVLVWFGHSSYFMQIDGKRILVDPVFSGSATPLWFGTKAFNGSDVYSADDIPEIDYLLISHDHWDHLDYKTIIKLKSKIKTIICPLGVGAHFEHWGYNPAIIIEKDWNEQINLPDNFVINTVPARHFSGRGIKRNKALWTSYVLQTPTLKIFIGGDSGYDTHFATIGKQFGPFDLTILENGQYDAKWRYIHLLPNELLQAAADLQTTRLLAVHSCKFVLANHPWHAPLTLLVANNTQKNIPLITPMIGEQVNLKDKTQLFTQWWENVN